MHKFRFVKQEAVLEARDFSTNDKAETNCLGEKLGMRGGELQFLEKADEE